MWTRLCLCILCVYLCLFAWVHPRMEHQLPYASNTHPYPHTRHIHMFNCVDVCSEWISFLSINSIIWFCSTQSSTVYPEIFSCLLCIGSFFFPFFIFWVLRWILLLSGPVQRRWSRSTSFSRVQARETHDGVLKKFELSSKKSQMKAMLRVHLFDFMCISPFKWKE